MQHLTAAERMHTFHVTLYINWNQNMDGKSLGFFDKGQGNQNLNQISL